MVVLLLTFKPNNVIILYNNCFEVLMEHSNITYKKIAEALNVSQSTVSKALSGSREVSTELSERIYLAAKEMGYFTQKRVRNREYAKNFRPEVAILVPEIVSIYYSGLATRFTEEIASRGGKASLYITGFSKDEVDILLDEIYDEVRFDGVMVLGTCKYGGEIKLPTVVIDSSQNPKFDSLHSNLEAGIREAVRHLAELGHEKIGFVGETLTAGKEMIFRKVLAEEGLPIKEEYIFCISERFEAIGNEAGKRLARLKELPTALITAYDEIAIGLISSLKENGLNVPQDISVIGTNDIPVAKYLCPPLTTIATHTSEKCAIAVELLMRRIQDKSIEKITCHTEISATLVVRGSTAKAK